MVNSPTVNVKELIQDVLKKHNWNQKELAYRLSIKPETVTRWKKGKNQPTFNNINTLQKLLHGHEIEPHKQTSQEGQFSLSINVNLNDGNVKMSIDKLEREDLTGMLGSLIRKLTKKEKANESALD